MEISTSSQRIKEIEAEQAWFRKTINNLKIDLLIQKDEFDTIKEDIWRNSHQIGNLQVTTSQMYEKVYLEPAYQGNI